MTDNVIEDFDSLEPLIQELLLIIYQSKEGYKSAVERHPAEPAILLYNRMLGEIRAPYTIALELGMTLVKEEPLDLDGYLYVTLKDYLEVSVSQAPQEINGASLSLVEVLRMTPEGWSRFLQQYHPEADASYFQRLDFVMETYYLRHEEKEKEQLGALTALDSFYQETETIMEERRDVV